MFLNTKSPVEYAYRLLTMGASPLTENSKRRQGEPSGMSYQAAAQAGIPLPLWRGDGGDDNDSSCLFSQHR